MLSSKTKSMYFSSKSNPTVLLTWCKTEDASHEVKLSTVDIEPGPIRVGEELNAVHSVVLSGLQAEHNHPVLESVSYVSVSVTAV